MKTDDIERSQGLKESSRPLSPVVLRSVYATKQSLVWLYCMCCCGRTIALVSKGKDAV